MARYYSTPLSSQPDAAPPDFASLYYHAVPAQRVQQDIRHQPYADTGPRPVYNDFASVAQHAAVNILRDIPTDTIFASLEVLRSNLRGQRWPNLSHLLPQYYQALFALKDGPDDVVLELLNSASSPGSLTAPHYLHGNDSLSNDSLSNDSVATILLGQSPSSFSDHSIITPINPRKPLSHNSSTSASVGSHGSPAASSENYKCWCFVGEDHREFKTPGGFKRHMREHVTRYYCIPRDPVKYMENRTICAFCDVSNPDQIHLNTHSVPKCVGKSFTRKSAFIEHLKKKHDVSDGSVLADQSIYTVGKKYFACGFCVTCFSSLNEQVNHIDKAHYRLSHHIDQWDDDKVIQGLLLQPTVKVLWQSKLAATPHLQESRLRWDPTRVNDLQHRLEMSQEPAADLCQAVMMALDQSNYGRSEYGLVEPVTFTSLTDLGMDARQLFQPFQHRSGLSLLPSTLTQLSTNQIPRTTTPIIRSQHSTWDWNSPNNSTWPTVHEDWPSPQTASGGYGSPVSMMDYPADNRAASHSSLDGCESFMQQQHPGSLSSFASATGNLHALGGVVETPHSSRMRGNLRGVSPDVATGPHPRQVVEARGYPTQADMHQFDPTLKTQLAPSVLSHNHSASPLIQPSNAYSLGYQSTLPVRHSRRQGGRSGRDIEMDVDSDDMQRLMQYQDHVAGQRRSH